MLNLTKISIKKYTLILIVLFVASSVSTNIFFIKTSKHVSITGDLYNSIIESKNLKADILPPKLYIVESYLLILQISNEKDDISLKILLNKLEKYKTEYQLYHAYWANNITDNKVFNSLIKESHAHVIQFYNIYDNKFLPALKNSDHDKVNNVLVNDLNREFLLHKNIIEEVSKTIEKTSIEKERDSKKHTINTYIIISSIYIIVIIIITIIAILIFKKITSIEKDIKEVNLETELANTRLEKIIEGLSRFKHSVDNTLATINGYAIKSDLAGLNIYLNEVIMDKKEYDVMNYFQLDMIKNAGLQGLILSKIFISQSNKVKFSLCVSCKIKNVPIKSSHLSEIIGILLDNAIEASSKSADRLIKFDISESFEAIIFEISNSFDVLPDINKMFEKGWSTKGEKRGLGLYIVRNLISNYEYVTLNTIFDESFVKQEIVILK